MTKNQTYSITESDPLSACALVEAVQTCRRDRWDIETRTLSRLTADRDTFQFEANLIALENGKEVFRRKWEEAIARDHL